MQRRVTLTLTLAGYVNPRPRLGSHARLGRHVRRLQRLAPMVMPSWLSVAFAHRSAWISEPLELSDEYLVLHRKCLGRPNFVAAIHGTKRRQLILGGITTDVCL
jgi:hypothetical protein